MRSRTKARGNKTKITITLDEDIKTQLDEFTTKAENPKISNSSVIEDLLDYALNDNRTVLDELFPPDKRFNATKK